jgi:DNA-binding SARP family transcriptional activator
MTISTTLVLFGNPRLEHDQQVVALPRRRAMALLAYLAITRRAHSRDALVALLYPDLDESTGRAELRRILSALKSVLPEEVLIADRETVALSEKIRVDAWDFNSAASAETIEALAAAVPLYSDELMAGFTLSDSPTFDDWQFAQREGFRRQFIRVLRRLVDYHSEKGEFETAISHGKRWLAQDTLDEIGYRTLMRLYVRAEQTVAALRLYDECVRIMAAELQVQPEAETTRLYEMIKANRDDLPTIGIMPPRPRLIVGRETVLNDLKERLTQTVDTAHGPVIIVQGWPGVGKSTILSALAHDPAIENLFPDGVLWTSLGATPNLLSELSLWAGALGLASGERGTTLEALAAQIRSALHHRQMLILVDDVWMASHGTLFQVGGAHCAFVVSTRQNDIANALAPTPKDIYKLPVLTEDNALDLLRQLAPEVVEEHPDASLALVRDLEGLPLALQVAGRLLRYESQIGWGIEDLLQELRDGAKLLALQPPADVAYPQASPTITALLRKSTDSLSDDMRTRFVYLGMFAPKPATYDLPALAVAWGERDPRPAVRFLIDRGLLEPAGTGRFQMHALLVMHARLLAETIE